MTTASQPRVNLTHRLDALRAALHNMELDAGAEAAARELVTLIRASSEFRNMNALAGAAQQAESAETNEFPVRLRALIALMQQEVSHQATLAAVMIVSVDGELIKELRSGLEVRGYPVVIAGTPPEAHQILATQTIGVCVVDLVLAKTDGRHLIADLRCSPVTAALPIVTIIPQLASRDSDKRALGDEDGCFQKPVKISDIINFLDVRLKRGATKSREARRDPSTGIPNRAACCEAYSQVQKACSDSEPISLVLFGIHRFSTLARSAGPVGREAMIRQVATLLSSSFRSSDVVARWGVSDFAVIMPGEDHYGATKAIEKVLPALNRQTITTPSGKKIPITLCAGLTLVNNQTPVEDAAATAECHLYMAYHHAWNNPRKNWLVSDAIQGARRSETVALFLSNSAQTETLRRVLEQETFTVESFSSPGELRAAFIRQPYNLLIVDDGLTGIEGCEIVKQAQALPSQARLRTLMIVGGQSGVEASLKCGVDDYAINPLSIPRFRSQIRRLLWQREDAASQARMTIMVVDHEIPQLFIAGTALHQLGECRVMLARGPQDAIRRLQHTQPHYLIVDMTMPGMSGEAFVHAIPHLNSLKSMEIIVAAPASVDPIITHSAHKVVGSVLRPYAPIKFIKEIRSLIPSLGDESLPLPPVDLGPLEIEIQRVLTLPAEHA